MSRPRTPVRRLLKYSKISQDIKIFIQNGQQMKKVALEVAAGASIAGGRAFAAMKHVGLNVAADPLFTLAYTGVNGGLIIVTVDDPGLFSSQNEQDKRLLRSSC